MDTSPAEFWILLGVVALLVAATAIVRGLAGAGRIAEAQGRELMLRIRTWGFLVPVLMLPVILGPVALKVAAGILGLCCAREFSRATGLFRERGVSALVYVAIGLLTIASISGIDTLFEGAVPLLGLLIVAGAVCNDRPGGYLQRVSLGALAFLLFGVGIGYLGQLADQAGSGRIVLWLLLCIALNDVAAYLCGNLWGHRKLCPNISPGKTVAGALGAVVFTCVFGAVVGQMMRLPIDSTLMLAIAAALCSVCGTIGDLIISSVKRDVGIKDMSAALPGHGGILDRFDSLLLAAPFLYYFILWTHKFDSIQGSSLVSGV